MPLSSSTRLSASFLCLTLLGASPAERSESNACATYDWAGVGWNRANNAALAAKTDPARVVFIGDSITAAWSKTGFVAADIHKVGRGLGGQTASQMLVRFRSDVIDLKPAIVHIMAGTNDVARNNGPETPSEIAGYIISMAELARANGIRVVIALIPPASQFPWRPAIKPGPIIAEVNGMLRAYGRQHPVVLADYEPALGDGTGGVRPGMTLDGVHPSPAGYAAMQPIAMAAVTRAAKLPLSK